MVMETKVKKRNKKGAGAGGLPAAIDLEIREADTYRHDLLVPGRERMALFSSSSSSSSLHLPLLICKPLSLCLSLAVS